MKIQSPDISKKLDPIRIVVVDNQLPHLMQLNLFMESHERIFIVGTAKDGLTALKIIEKEQPDIVLLTVEVMPVIGIAVFYFMTQLSKVMILNWDKDHETWPQISLSDIKGYVHQGAELIEVEKAIYAVDQGQFYISKPLQKTLLSSKFLAQELHTSQSVSLQPEASKSALSNNPTTVIPPIDETSQPALLADPVVVKVRNRWQLALLAGFAAIALVILGVLIRRVLLPAFDDPNSKAFSSSLGYPAAQRMMGLPIQVATVKAQTQEVTEGISAQGEAVALDAIQVSALVTGPVAQVQVAEGDRVRKGQVLFRLRQQPFKDSVQTAKTQVAIAQQDLKNSQQLGPNLQAKLQAQVNNAQQRIAIATNQLAKLQILADQGAISKAQILDQQDIIAQRRQELILAEQELSQNLNSAATNRTAIQLTIAENLQLLQQAMRNLENTVVSSPVDGLVTALTVNPGERVSPDVPVLTVSQDIVFKVDIDQTKINAIQVGNTASVRLVAYPGQVFAGKVVRVNPTVATGNSPQRNPPKQSSEQQRQFTYPVWVKMQQPQLVPGLQGYARFGRPKSRLLVPEQAVTHFSGGEGLVMAAIDGKAVVKSVKVGKVWGNQREIIAGLTPGESVVLSPQALQPNDDIVAQPVNPASQSE